METRNCIVCGREFTPLSANAKYCSGTCSDRGQAIRRREWENRTGYREKRRIQAQERRNAIKAAAEAERETAALRRKEAQTRRRSESTDSSAVWGAGNRSPEYWEAYKEYDLKWAADNGLISRTEVNGIPTTADDFGRLVCETIVEGKHIIERAMYERKPAQNPAE